MLKFQNYLESINQFHFLCVVRMYYVLFHNFLSNNLFYLFSNLTLILKINSMFFFKFWLNIYSLNLALCLHLAISSFLLFNNFFGSGKSKMCIFSSRHRLHLLSKDFGVLDLFNMDHCMSGVNLLSFNPQ